MAALPLGGAGLSHSLYEKFADICYHGESARIAGALEKGFSYERNPQSKLDPRVKNVWRVNDVIWIVLGYLCCAAPFAICAAIEPAPWAFALVAVLSVIAVVLLVVFLVVLPPIRYARWRYELHDDYLDIVKGIIWRKRYIIPFIRVQNTDTRQGPILRAFGLSSVTVATAAGEHVIPGLANDVADQVRDRTAELARIAREDM